MSKRGRSAGDAGGAFDALVRAIAALGAVPSWVALPPPTAPDSLGRALGQGVLHGRLPHGAKGARPVDASPLPVERMRHEGQRSVAELGAILWHAMGGTRDAPELDPWMAPPHTDPIVALALSRRRRAEYAGAEAIDRSCAFPGERVWLVEIERAKGDVPGAIAVWRSPGVDGEWRTRCACVWTHGRSATATHPLVIGAQWDVHGNEAVAAACVIGPSWDDATRAAGGGSRAAALARRRNAIGKQMMATIVVPAALAWLDHHAGSARPAGRFGAGDAPAAGSAGRYSLPARTVRPVAAVARTPPPPWLSAGLARAVEAIVIGVAREGFRIGASCPVPAWRRGWAGYAEMGAIVWHAIADRQAQIDSDTWCAMEHALREDGLEARSAHPALAATSALVRKMLAQTGRSHVARAPDARTLCALEIPARLWRALGEAGPCPQPTATLNLGERWWLVEVEAPADDEPNAIALWEESGAEVALAAFLCVEDGNNAPILTVVSWRTAPDGERTAAGVAVLKQPVHIDDPDNPESQAGTRHVIDTLAAPEIGSVARAKTAIAVHLASDGAAAPLGNYRPSTASARTATERAPPGHRSATALFAIERAPEPETAQEAPTGKGHHGGAGAQLQARQRVRAHWKRQAFGPKHSRRRWIVVESYRRGPAPGEDQITITRLAHRQLRTGHNAGEPREGRKAGETRTNACRRRMQRDGPENEKQQASPGSSVRPRRFIRRRSKDPGY